MKNIEIPTTPDADIEAGQAELTFIPDFQDTPFTIRDSEESLRPLAVAIIRRDMATERRHTAHVARSAVKAVISPAKAITPAIRPLAEGIGTEIKVTAFDLMNGTNLRAELHRQRRVRRITSFASGLGILDIEPCAKHRKAMERAEGLQ